MEDRLPGKLAAILYADVAGYSRLTGEDEEGTHRRLSEYLDLISDSIEAHQGKVVHYAGDAVLAEFGTVTGALKSATGIQRELANRNRDLPDQRKVKFRIGVNLGEVIVDRDDIYGDGVNVAARLESLANPGGICVSDSVRTALGNKLQLDFEDLGEQEVKNISTPVHAYHVRLQTGSARSQIDSDGPSIYRSNFQTPDAGKPSIAVLPFANMSSDLDQEYFADGLTEDLITELSKFRSLLVVARNSSFAFKGQSNDVKEVGLKLGVRYMVEGSVRKSGNRVRVTGQLIDTQTGNHVWAERYDRDLEDIFAVQDELVRHIVTTVGGRIEEAGKIRVGRLNDSELQAYDLCLRAQSLQDRNTKDDYLLAEKCLLQAIESDSTLGTSSSSAVVSKVLRMDGGLDGGSGQHVY